MNPIVQSRNSTPTSNQAPLPNNIVSQYHYSITLLRTRKTHHCSTQTSPSLTNLNLLHRNHTFTLWIQQKSHLVVKRKCRGCNAAAAMTMGGCAGRKCPCSLFQTCRSCAIAPSLNPSNFASPIPRCTMDSQLYTAMHWDCGSICSHPPSLTKAPECQWFAIHLCTSIKQNIDIHKRTRGKFIFVGCLFCCSHSFFCIRCCHDGLLCSSPSLAECLPCKQM